MGGFYWAGPASMSLIRFVAHVAGMMSQVNPKIDERTRTQRDIAMKYRSMRLLQQEVLRDEMPLRHHWSMISLHQEHKKAE